MLVTEPVHPRGVRDLSRPGAVAGGVGHDSHPTGADRHSGGPVDDGPDPCGQPAGEAGEDGTGPAGHGGCPPGPRARAFSARSGRRSGARCCRD
ncbi:hypothetical protein SLI_2267 [Streptomyces lividans 1326]|uniref:Uncharacterized protein n=1 Tax=Streptomyces lividans 1326 TaxID=1200984 RepID=A0A7U9DQ17_STRLI|nr:hypothetical protein SLI_2267 [Streptomyces lividans 1326]